MITVIEKYLYCMFLGTRVEKSVKLDEMHDHLVRGLFLSLK